LVLGFSSTRKAARLAVYDATMIMAKPAHTIPELELKNCEEFLESDSQKKYL